MQNVSTEYALDSGSDPCRLSCYPIKRSSPLSLTGNTSNGLICAKCGVECEDCGTEDCKCEDDYVIATIPKVFFRKVEMHPVPEN